MTNRYGQLRYPLSLIEDTTSYFMVNIVEKIPTTINRNLSGNNPSQTFSTSKADGISDVFGASGKSTKGSIILPMPLGISDSNSVSWADSSLNMIEQFATSRGLDLMNTDFSNPGDGIKSVINQLGSAGNDAAAALQNSGVSDAMLRGIMAGIVKSFGSNTTGNSLLSRTTGQVLNPHLELLFDGVNLRQFSYAFKFTPRSREESQQVKRIINVFKRSMSAKTTASGPQGWFIKNPDVYELSFKRGGNDHPFLYTHKTCALVGLDVNYSDASNENYASYYDGTPIALTMSLDFTELSPVYNEDYNDGFSDENLDRGVGY